MTEAEILAFGEHATSHSIIDAEIRAAASYQAFDGPEADRRIRAAAGATA